MQILVQLLKGEKIPQVNNTNGFLNTIQHNCQLKYNYERHCRQHSTLCSLQGTSWGWVGSQGFYSYCTLTITGYLVFKISIYEHGITKFLLKSHFMLEKHFQYIYNDSQNRYMDKKIEVKVKLSKESSHTHTLQIYLF